MADNQYDFPTEELSLPSKGLLYSKDSPLSSGKIEVKYMTAKEEDILFCKIKGLTAKGRRTSSGFTVYSGPDRKSVV